MESAVPPSSERLKELHDGLREIRETRRLSHWPFHIAIGLALFFGFIRSNFPSFDGSFADKMIVALLGVAFVVGIVLIMFVSVIDLRCPRCREFFHAKKRRYRNDFARKCLNCGLRLDGRNAGDAF